MRKGHCTFKLLNGTLDGNNILYQLCVWNSFLCAKSTSKCENARVGCVWERKRDSECHVSFMERVSERERERERERENRNA